MTTVCSTAFTQHWFCVSDQWYDVRARYITARRENLIYCTEFDIESQFINFNFNIISRHAINMFVETCKYNDSILHAVTFLFHIFG